MRIEEAIGLRVAERRKAMKLSQPRLGELVGEILGRTWSRQAVWATETGQRAFTAVELLALAEVLGTTVGRLLMPTAEVDQIEMPDGTVRTREEIERLVVDPEARNVLPAAFETIERVGIWLNEHLASGNIQMRKLRDDYESLTINRRLPDDGLRAREADLEEQTRKAWGISEDEDMGAASARLAGLEDVTGPRHAGQIGRTGVRHSLFGQPEDHPVEDHSD